MANNESNVIIRPENPSEYEAVNKLIYTAFAEQHGIETGNITQLVLSQSAVLPEYRMQGIMRMLVEYALDNAEKLGYGAVFLGGNPNLYARYGFEPSSLYGIYHENREKWGDEGFMVCILKAGVLNGVTGTTSYYGG